MKLCRLVRSNLQINGGWLDVRFFALVKLAGVRLPSLWDPSRCFPDGMRGIDLAARNKTDCELIEQAERLKKKLNLRPLRPCQRGYWVYQPREIFRHVFGHAMTSYLLQQESEEWITDVDFKRILMLRSRTSDILSCISDPAQVEQPVPADVLVAACVLLDSPGLSRHVQYAATVQAINNMANYDAKSRQTEQIHLAAIRSTGRAMAHYSLTSRRVYQFGEPNSYVPGRRAPIAAPTMDRDLARRLNGRKPAPLAALPEREYPGDAAVLAERLRTWITSQCKRTRGVPTRMSRFMDGVMPILMCRAVGARFVEFCF